MPGDWTKQADITSKRAQLAVTYGDTMARIVNGSGESFDAVAALVDPARFVRRGNERDQPMDWPTYRAMLEQWQDGSGKYEKLLYRATEAAMGSVSV